MSDYYKAENQERRRNSGRGWMVATLLLAAFVLGAVVMKLAVPQGDANGIAAATGSAALQASETALATPTPTSTASTLGGPAVSIGSGTIIDIPSIAKAIGPTVVGVNNKVKMQQRGQSALGEDTLQGTGSGVIVSSDGYIVTNDHVVENADTITVTMPGGEEVPAKLIGTDAQTDLALLKIEKTGLPAAPLGDSDQVQVGESVVAIGNPLGTELAGTVTSGIISATNREVTSESGYTFHLLQTDAAINPGNSGGALVNAKGELIGINNMKETSAGMNISAEGIGFAIPANTVKPIIEQLKTNGTIPRPMIGISIESVIGAEEAKYYNVPEGVVIAAVTEGGPAAKAGLKAQDLITMMDGQKATTMAEIRTILGNHKIGDTIKVTFWREGETKTVEVTLEAMK